MARKIFNYDNLTESKTVLSLKDEANMYEHSISACGCLLYKYINGEVHLLLVKYTNPKFPLLDDLGGKIELTDDSLFEAMAREVAEETNQIIDVAELQRLVNSSNSIHHYYNQPCKYFATVIEVPENYLMDTSIFGSVETGNQIGRTLKWFPVSQAITQLSIRISTLPAFWDSREGTVGKN
jgi:8-oxo-dGTP pyrophosphatase MutT (NUDIX family)